MILSYMRTVILYVALITVIRLMGKRQIGQMEPSEFVVTMLVANLAAIPMQEEDMPLLSGLVPMLIVLIMELTFSYLSMKSIRLRKLLCGKPVILIENGKVIQKNLRRTLVTLDELSGHLREKDVLDPRTVQFAILETSGDLSVFPYPAQRPASAKEAGIHPKRQYLPITIVEDGSLSEENLSKAGKDRRWLRSVLAEKRATVQETLLLTVDEGDHITWLGKEDNP